MTDEKSPDVDDIKIRLGDEIPFEDDTETLKAEQEQVDVVDELRDLGRQFGETITTAWNSEERKQFESEVREGIGTFFGEVDKAFQGLKSSSTGQRAQEGAEKVKDSVDASDAADTAKSSLAQALRWFGNDMSKLADQFTPPEKAPPEDETTE